MITSTNTARKSEQTQCPLIIKTLSNLGTEWEHPYLDKRPITLNVTLYVITSQKPLYT